MVFAARLNRAAACDGQRASRFDHDACLISAADDQILALENQRDVCGVVSEEHRAHIVRIGIVNGQVAGLDRYRRCRVNHKALVAARSGDGDDLRGVKLRRGQSAAVFDLDHARRVAVHDCNAAFADVKVIALGAFGAHGEGLRYSNAVLGKGNGVFTGVLDLSGVINGTRPAGSVNCKSCAAEAEAGAAERCCGIEHRARFLKIRSDCDLRGFHNEAAAAGE